MLMKTIIGIIVVPLYSENVPDMKTPIQIAKIKAVILYIMQSFPDGVDYIKLFKILYFAQQDHLVRYGKVLVDESFRAVKHGPVPTYTYKALQIAEGKPLEGDFEDFLSGIEVRDKKPILPCSPIWIMYPVRIRSAWTLR